MERFAGLSHSLWGGYCVSTVGLDEEQIRKYVRWQMKKDQDLEQLRLWSEE